MMATNWVPQDHSQVIDTSSVSANVWTSRYVPTSRTSGGIWLRYAPHNPRPPKVIDTTGRSTSIMLRSE